jgi:hypothetical protein
LPPVENPKIQKSDPPNVGPVCVASFTQSVAFSKIGRKKNLNYGSIIPLLRGFTGNNNNK